MNLSSENSKITSGGMTIIMTLLLGTILAAHIVVLNAYAQGPPPGSPASQPSPQLVSLTDRWTKWIVSIDTSLEDNPFTTTYQDDCSQLTQGNIMFLVGQTGTGDVDHGECIVSSGTSIFFPVINYVTANCIKDKQERGKPHDMNGNSICQIVLRTPAIGQPFGDPRQEANNFINQVSNLEATLDEGTVDEVPVDFVRVESPPGGFGVRVSDHNALFGDLSQDFGSFGTVSLHSVVDGYWVLLPPLSPGDHTLTFGACDPSGCQTNDYKLVVQ
jgi:hypothetical protein